MRKMPLFKNIIIGPSLSFYPILSSSRESIKIWFPSSQISTACCYNCTKADWSAFILLVSYFPLTIFVLTNTLDKPVEYQLPEHTCLPPFYKPWSLADFPRRKCVMPTRFFCPRTREMALDTYVKAFEGTESHRSVQTFPKQKYYISLIRSIPNSAPESRQMKRRNLRALGFLYTV